MCIKNALTIKGVLALTFLVCMVSCSSNRCTEQVEEAPSWTKQSCFISGTKMFGVGISPLFQDVIISEKIAMMEAHRAIQEYNKVELESIQFAGSEIYGAPTSSDISLQYYSIASQSSNIHSHLNVEDFYVSDECFWILVSVDLEDISSI